MKTVKAQTLWYAIIESQVETGKPGMLFVDHCNLSADIVEYSSYEEVVFLTS